jgi:hypothetical protein
MAQFQLSPGVAVKETDLTSIIPSVATAIGGYAGTFIWGPASTIVNISSEKMLAQVFGVPKDENAADWYSAANYLGYSNYLKTVRVVNVAARNAVAAGSAVLIKNKDDFDQLNSRTSFTALVSLTGGATSATVIDSADFSIGDAITGSGIQAGTTVTGIPDGTHVTLSQASNVGTGSGTGTTTDTSTTIDVTGVTTAVLPGDGISGNGIPVGATVATVVDTNTITISAAATASAAGVTLTFTRANVTGTVTPAIIAKEVIAKYAGELGNGLEVSIADSASFANWAYRSEFSSATTATSSSKTTAVTFTGNTTSASNIVANCQILTGKFKIGQTVTGTGIPGSTTIADIINDTTIQLSATASATNTAVSLSGTVTETTSQFPGGPGTSSFVENKGGSNDELHVVVIDANGQFTGTAGAVLEKFSGLSKAFDAKNSEGAVNYYIDVVNSASNYVYIVKPITLTLTGQQVQTGSDSSSLFGTLPVAESYALTGGLTGNASVTTADRIQGFSLFRSSEEVDVTLVFGGVCTEDIADYLIDNIGDYRRDCVVFVSPPMSAVVNTTTPEANVLAFRNKLNSSSYAVLDSGWKYQYDTYNDKYRWVPLNADIAGLCASVDSIADTWWSPAGFNRGYIKNVVKLAWNPGTRAQRDNLYQVGINPICTFAGIGTVMYGDKTLQAKPSAFDRINVRRLFILLEKAIATYSKFVLFEFNDAITRNNFVNTVVPYLRDIQGRRGITDFKVIANETVNTGEVIDANGFVAKILIKPARSINFIELNFVAVGSSVSFEEIA